MLLKNDSLLKDSVYINGQWVGAENESRYPVLNPFDRTLIGYVPDMGARETRKAVEAAQDAFKTWRSYSAGKRAGEWKPPGF